MSYIKCGLLKSKILMNDPGKELWDFLTYLLIAPPTGCEHFCVYGFPSCRLGLHPIEQNHTNTYICYQIFIIAIENDLLIRTHHICTVHYFYAEDALLK